MPEVQPNALPGETPHRREQTHLRVLVQAVRQNNHAGSANDPALPPIPRDLEVDRGAWASARNGSKGGFVLRY